MDYATLLQILDSTLRLATPLLLACLAGLFSERAGIFDIGLEGKMLMAAMSSGAVAYLTGSVWIGLLARDRRLRCCSRWCTGVASITFRGNQLISGVALNFVASGITVLIAQDLFGQGGRTPPLEGAARFNPIDLPFAEALRACRCSGRFYAEVISGHTFLVYVALLLVPLSWWVLYRTRFGLRLRAVGENPAAVDTAGVSVVRLRYAAVAITGVLCGLAGAYMATALQAGFGKEMTAGRGYIALAALIFAKWRPWYCAVGDAAVRVLPGAGAAARRDREDDRPVKVPVPAAGRAALYPDGGGAGGVRRQGDPAARRRRALCQGALILPPSIRARAGAAPVRLGLILGSGLGHLAGAVEGVAIPYADLPGFPHAGVSGHNPNLVVGDLEGVRVAVFGARAHYYENGNPAAMRLPLEVLKALGAEALIATNAAGSLRPDIRPGRSDAAVGPHQLFRPEPADRRADRRALRADDRRA